MVISDTDYWGMGTAMKMDEEFQLLDGIFDDLWPIMRSISGEGLERSFEIISRYMPLQVTKINSGEKVFDWTVPPEWQFNSAILTGPDGEVICDAAVNNLHVVNYSEAVEGIFNLDQLQPHLHSLPELPAAVPYVTSYYKRTWGFCLTHEQRSILKEGNYHVKIDSDFVAGGVSFAQTTLDGDSDKEILLTSYLCHPSMANNELSGPLGLLALYNRIKAWPKRRYTYRFLLNPETIGSLCFLSKHAGEMKEKLISGLILTCLGGKADGVRYKASRMGNSVVDQVVSKISSEKKNDPNWNIKIKKFSPRDGSDERQFCAPGFNLPMGQVARVVYGEYDGYHNSLDTKEFMGIKNIQRSVDTIEEVLKYAETCGKPVNMSPFGEPQLGSRNLYPNMNSAQTREQSEDSLLDGRIQLNYILTLLNMADGENSLFDIVKECGCNVDDLIPILNKLENENLIKFGVEKPTL